MSALSIIGAAIAVSSDVRMNLSYSIARASAQVVSVPCGCIESLAFGGVCICMGQVCIHQTIPACMQCGTYVGVTLMNLMCQEEGAVESGVVVLTGDWQSERHC